MELSLEKPSNQQSDNNSTYRRQKINSLCPPSSSCQIIDENDIIDLSKLNLNDDENWLLECSNKSATDLEKWLYSDDYVEDSLLPSDLNLNKEYTKNIDTRTFTRPKKRFTRPSIEKYNEELYGNEMNSSLTDSGIQLNGCSQEDKPLHFDLAQPVTNSYYFENILANAAMAESFQNMSPPSLVNSMCSSMFANLMESSVIKNDPVLKEIRDTDYTGMVLQQESEPMFQSITESCSSLNSDVTENLLKKISFNEKNSSGYDDEAADGNATVIMNTTFAKNKTASRETITLDYHDDVDFEETKVPETVNSTFSQRLNGTYQVSEINNGPVKLNSTFQRRKSNRLGVLNNSDPLPQLNQTVTIECNRKIDERPLETKRLLDRRPSPSLDLNRLSYQADKTVDRLNQTYTNENTKRNSIESSDSTENLDYMSLSSGSSKISSTDGINVIVDVQDRSLQQVISTPKPKTRGQLLWHSNDISPISGRNSDPELSSSEKIEAKPTLMANSIKKQKSTGNIASKMPPPRTVMGALTKGGGARGSQPNLRIPETRTYGLQRTSNLNSMGHTLKGSYTSLKPMNTNLPVAPPPLDTTVTVAKVVPVPRETAPKNENAQFAKPQPYKSALPRPVTGIPRPVSRIPGPRSVRPVSKSAGQQGRQTNHY